MKTTRGLKRMLGGDAKIASSLTAMVSKLEDLEQLLDTLTDGVVILDGAGRFIHLNRGAENAFGIARSEMKGKSFWEGPSNLRLETDASGGGRTAKIYSRRSCRKADP